MFDTYGYATYTQTESQMLKELDREIVALASGYQMSEWTIPSLINGEVLERCGYFSTLPNNLSKVGIVDRNRLNDFTQTTGHCCSDLYDQSMNLYLTPAACLHLYPALEGRQNKDEVITTLARVYRYEDEPFVRNERQWEFLVREFVAVGSEAYVKSFLSDMQEKLLHFAKSLNPNITLVNASDHFYATTANKVKERYQISNQMKQEMVFHAQDLKLAIASFNYHYVHFSSEFHFDHDNEIVTGCVGCGLDRWMKLKEDELC